jgi:flagella basal body P-ring formation protein FlgA
MDRTQVEIELRPDVVVPHRQVRLGEVAILRTTDLAAIRRLVDLPLGDAPRMGAEAVMDRAVVGRWIRSRLGLGEDQLIWRGAERSRVKGAVQVLPSQQIEQSARAALEQWLRARSSRFDIESIGLARDIDLPSGQLELRPRPLARGSHPASRMVVWVDAWVDGGFVRTVPVSFSVAAYNEAWVARSAVASQAVLSGDMLERREVDIAAAPASAWPAGPAGASPALRSLRALKAGETLDAQNARVPLPVARGDWVTLEFSAGAMRLQGRAEALQEGDLGQLVKVRVSGASGSMEARVVDRGRVEAMP